MSWGREGDITLLFLLPTVETRTPTLSLSHSPTPGLVGIASRTFPRIGEAGHEEPFPDSLFQFPLCPPVLARRCTSPMRMSLVTDLHMS